MSDPQHGELADLPLLLLQLLNRYQEQIDSIRDVLSAIKDTTGIEAVGIRLAENEDYPYYTTIGFPEEFVELERYLCGRDIEGQIVRDEEHKPELACMCGNVICGRTDPSLPFFTENGSFWSNCTTELLATTTEEERQASTRNRCNSEGYESVALIPLRSDDEIVGLLQLNDTRRDVFTPELIGFFEKVGASIGIALARKHSEDALRTVNAELEAFAHTVSHDLKSPLAAAGSAVDVIKILREKPLTGDALGDIAELLDAVVRSVGRAATIVDELLVLAEAGQVPQDVREIDVGRVVQEVLEENAGVIADRRLEVRMDDRLGTILANESQVYQVFSNLIGNATKHNVSTEPVIEVRSLPGGVSGEHRYLVRDNGSGIPREDLDKVFLPFFRGVETGETGIGLSTVEKIVKVYGGSIRAYNDSGACFEFVMRDAEPRK